jgi:hypothetical protein
VLEAKWLSQAAIIPHLARVDLIHILAPPPNPAAAIFERAADYGHNHVIAGVHLLQMSRWPHRGWRH